MKFIFSFLIATSFLLPMLSTTSHAKGRPRLAVVIVFDQLRSDQIVRHLNEFSKDGFNLFFKHGAVAPYAEYRHLQNMTCPGHATILSGAWPAQHKIPLNEWYDKKTQKVIYCVKDENGILSPALAGGGHLSDELKLADPRSKIVSVALKDRASILLGGRTSDAAYWYDSEKNKFISSSYYKKIKSTLSEFSVESIPQKGANLAWSFASKANKIEHKSVWGDKNSFLHPVSTNMTVEAAQKLITEYQLGQDESPDLLAVSFSAHDLVGHQFGPYSPEVLETLRQEDHALARLISFIKNKMKGSLDDVVFVITSDHGTAPLETEAKQLGLDAGRVSQEAIREKLNLVLNQKFPRLCKNEKSKDGPILMTKSLQFYLGAECPRILSEEFEATVKESLASYPGVEEVLFTRPEHSTSWPAFFARSVEVSYVADRSGDFVVMPKPYWYVDEGPPNNHMTSYSYDRYVPLLFLGKAFRNTQSFRKTEVVDLAPTLAAIFQITPPAQSQGRILEELLRTP